MIRPRARSGWVTAAVVVAGAALAAALQGLPTAMGRSAAAKPAMQPQGEQLVSAQDSLAALLRRRLGELGEDALGAAEPVRRFYEQRAFALAWSRAGEATGAAQELAEALRSADDHGLSAEAYGVGEIEVLLGRAHAAGDAAAVVELDLRLSDAFLTLGNHLLRGRMDPSAMHAGWSLAPRDADLVGVLDAAVRGGAVREVLEGLAPQAAEYARLRTALRRYRDLEARGGWPALGPGRSLRPGETGEAVARLRARLAAEVALPRSGTPDLFNADLEQAVRAFQRSHGLADDAIIGPATRAALNESPARRADQIALNLERLRWLPADLGERHVRINIPAFELVLVESGRTVIEMRIIGGRADWPTPIFSGRISSVVLSPYWNIPPNIAAREVVPKARRDPGYLLREEIRVVAGYGANERTVSPYAIDWSRFNARGGAYRLRQDPGPLNPLGGVKFLFPNRYSVYLHDTPARHLFAEPERAFSHGCMRMEKPLELADYLLDDLGWDRQRIVAAIARRAEHHIALPDPLPVHILYQTAWVDAAGVVQFRTDLYGHDRRLTRALQAGTAPEVSQLSRGECEAFVT